MYIEDFDTFYQQAADLYRASPTETRYNIKYRNCDGKLVLKVTDDKVCLKFKTDQQADLKKLERITNLFFGMLAREEEGEGEPIAEQQRIAQATPAKGKKSRKKG